MTADSAQYQEVLELLSWLLHLKQGIDNQHRKGPKS